MLSLGAIASLHACTDTACQDTTPCDTTPCGGRRNTDPGMHIHSSILLPRQGLSVGSLFSRPGLVSQDCGAHSEESPITSIGLHMGDTNERVHEVGSDIDPSSPQTAVPYSTLAYTPNAYKCFVGWLPSPQNLFHHRKMVCKWRSPEIITEQHCINISI